MKAISSLDDAHRRRGGCVYECNLLCYCVCGDMLARDVLLTGLARAADLLERKESARVGDAQCIVASRLVNSQGGEC